METYRGVVKGKHVELQDAVVLPEGTEVEVVVREHQDEEMTASGYPKSSPQALLYALASPPACSPEDVHALLNAIEQGKLPVRYAGVFENKSERP